MLKSEYDILHHNYSPCYLRMNFNELPTFFLGFKHTYFRRNTYIKAHYKVTGNTFFIRRSIRVCMVIHTGANRQEKRYRRFFHDYWSPDNSHYIKRTFYKTTNCYCNPLRQIYSVAVSYFFFSNFHFTFIFNHYVLYMCARVSTQTLKTVNYVLHILFTGFRIWPCLKLKKV